MVKLELLNLLIICSFNLFTRIVILHRHFGNEKFFSCATEAINDHIRSCMTIYGAADKPTVARLMALSGQIFKILVNIQLI